MPVIYRYNKKAWMLSGLWYEYLTELNNDMALAGRKIILVTDNCPSHPLTDKPPKGYTGPSPPQLTHVTLVYLPKNTTPFFQPLDQGIIRSFKASYRRKYAQQLVESFNSTHMVPKPIDILQVIHLISEAWMELPPAVIYNCWQEAGIHPQLEKITHEQTSYQDYLAYLSKGTSIHINTLLDPVIGCHHSGQAEAWINDFLFHDEDEVDLSISSESIDIIAVIAEVKQTNIRNLKHQLHPPEPILPLPLPSISEALLHIHEVTRYLEALPVTILPHPNSQYQVLQMSNMVTDFQNLRLALQAYQLANKKQQSLFSWLAPAISSAERKETAERETAERETAERETAEKETAERETAERETAESETAESDST